MDAHRLTKVTRIVNLTLLVFLLVTVTSSVTGSGRRYYDDLFPVVERRGGSPACRRCALNRRDWASCTACYRHARLGSGRIPYYGKRSSLMDNDVLETPGDVIECCAETGNPECCAYARIRRQLVGEEAAPRYDVVPVNDDGDGPVCSCCHLALYDIVCCQAACDV